MKLTNEERFQILDNLLLRRPVKKSIGKELVFLKRLVSFISNKDFWLSYKPEKVESLILYNGIWGKEKIRKAYNVFLTNNESTKIEIIKCDDEETKVSLKVRKPKTSKEFLNG